MQALYRLAVLLAMALGCCPPHAANEPAHAPGAAQVERLTVALTVTDAGETHTYCTGTWVGPHEVLTAAHCADGYAHLRDIDDAEVGMTMEVQPRRDDASRLATLSKIDREHDLALLRTVVRCDDYASLGPAPQVGDPIAIDGHPYGIQWSYMQGIVSSIRKFEGENVFYLQLDIDGAPGDSGSGVFDSRGRLVGVLVSGVRKTSIMFAVHRAHVEDFLAGAL
jgi:hypothetical protein